MSTMLRPLPGLLLSTIILGSIAAQTPSAIEQRIQRIQELPPPVIVKGEPVATTKLADRMAALHVPGVSIAVIHDGKEERYHIAFADPTIPGPKSCYAASGAGTRIEQ